MRFSGSSTDLDTQFGLPFHLGQVILENRFRNENRREHVGDQTYGQRDSEALDRASAEIKEEERRDDGRYVRVDDGQKGLVETGVDGGGSRLAVAQFFADALEDENIGVHAHTDRQDDTGDAGKSKHGARRA